MDQAYSKAIEDILDLLEKTIAYYDAGVQAGFISPDPDFINSLIRRRNELEAELEMKTMESDDAG